MMRLVRQLAMVLVAVLVSARPARAEDAAALLDAAKSAAAAGRYCDALSGYQKTFALTNDAKHLFNAAEVAFAADDKVTALQLFREVLAKFPDYPKRLKVEQRIAELGRSIAKSGAGTACASAVRPAAAVPAAAACGNGVLDGTGEQCDDANRVEGDGCDANCSKTSCGNGIRTSGELCDDGNAVAGDGCDGNCTMSACGNGVVAGNEQCDDGNSTGGDGCAAACTTEVAVARATAPSSPLPWLVGGAVTAAVGAVAGVVGFVPAIGYASREPALAQLEGDFADANDADEQSRIADEVEELHEAQANDVDSYNTWGRWLAPAGLVLVGVGIVVAVVGFVGGTEEGAE